MATTHFADMPNISLPRTKMPLNPTHSTSFKHGRLIPLFSIFVQPGDSFHLDIASLIRMSTPKYPIFGNISVHVHSWFVPMRLVFDKTEEFFGENKTSKGPQTEDIKLPSMKFGKLGTGGVPDSKTFGAVGSISHYLGKPLATGTHSALTFAGIDVNVLKERAYCLIWNDGYRAQQFQDPMLVYTGSESKIAAFPNGTEVDFSTECLRVNKKFDYFTSVTQSPQYSANPVELPLGEYAPLGFLYDTSDDDLKYYQPHAYDDINGWTSGSNGMYSSYAIGLVAGKDALHNTGVFGVDDGVDYIKKGVDGTEDAFSLNNFRTNAIVNLSEAVAANVNTIRTAFSLQRYLERDNFGTRYPEIIKAHFAVTSSLAILQRPQLLKKASFSINVSQVLTTAESDDRAVGQPGANSVTANRSDIVDNAFDEFGFLFVLLETKHDQLYSQGLDAFDLKLSKFDFYFPEFASIGDQAIKNKQILATYGSDGAFDPEGVFGYQEAWAEYRYMPDRVSGLLDPNAPQNLSFTNLGLSFGPSEVNGVNGEWLYESRQAITRALVSGETGPDYLGDFVLTGTMIRTMPLYSIPGLVDHVGGR